MQDNIESRQFERRLYNYFRSKINDSEAIELPKTWEEFITQLRQQTNFHGSLNDKERGVLWQSGTAFKIGCRLIEEKKFNDWSLPEHAIEAAGLQLIAFGCFLQLKEWIHKLHVSNKHIGLVSKIKNFILKDTELRELRNALAHSGSNNNETYFVFSNDSTIKFKTVKAEQEQSINVYKLLFASLVLWVVFSEWAYHKIC